MTDISLTEFTSLIVVDHSGALDIDPYFLIHKDLDTMGPVGYDLNSIKETFIKTKWLFFSYSFSSEKESTMKGASIYQGLRESNLLSECLGLRDLYAIKQKDISIFRKFFPGKKVFAWKSAVRDREGKRFVPFLYEKDNKMSIGWRCINLYWNSIQTPVYLIGR